MAISTKKRNAIIAMWKTGNFKSYTAIAKHYKISTKTAQKIIGENSHAHEDIVELGVQYEMAKKSTKNPHDINSIEKVVQGRIDTMELDNELIENNRKLAKLAQGVVLKNKDKFDHSNIRNLTGALKDIENIANPQSGKVEINTQNNNQVNNTTEIEVTKIES